MLTLPMTQPASRTTSTSSTNWPTKSRGPVTAMSKACATPAFRSRRHPGTANGRESPHSGRRRSGGVPIQWRSIGLLTPPSGFFPIERDPQLGWRLHLFDVATNKALALSARSETRDYVDIVELHKRYPLPAICWAACGKDPGFSPLFLLKMMKRFARLDPAKLDKIQGPRA